MSAQRRPATKRDASGSGSRRSTGGRQSGSGSRAATVSREQAAVPVDAVDAGGAAVAAAPASQRASASSATTVPAKTSKPAPAKTKEESKPNAFAERGGRLRKIFDDTRAEMKKITWPDRETTRNLTIVVIGISIALGILLGGIDYVLFQVFEALP